MTPQIPILDHGYVQFIDAMGSDERIIESARMSTGKGFLGWGPTCPHCGGKLLEALAHATPGAMRCVDTKGGVGYGCGVVEPKPGDEKLLRFLWTNKHTSPFEQCALTVEVMAPIFIFREWHRHRTQSYNEFSARYEKMPDVHYVPTLGRLKLAGGANKQAGGVADLADDLALLTWLTEAQNLQQRVYSHYEAGLDIGVPKEVARLNTPVSRYSKMVASANLLNWLRFLGLRMAPNAQWEIRMYANAVGAIVAERFPRTWSLFQERAL